MGTCSLSILSQAYINVSRTIKLMEHLNAPGSQSPGSHSLPAPSSSSSTWLVFWGNNGQSQQCMAQTQRASGSLRTRARPPWVWLLLWFGGGMGLPTPMPDGSQALDTQLSYTSIPLCYHEKTLTRSPFSKDSVPEMPRPIDPTGKGCLLYHVLSQSPTSTPWVNLLQMVSSIMLFPIV